MTEDNEERMRETLRALGAFFAIVIAIIFVGAFLITIATQIVEVWR
jgi:hypothetical protein